MRLGRYLNVNTYNYTFTCVLDLVPTYNVYHWYFSDSVETLAWSSAQIHCLCTTSNKVNTSEASSKLPTQVAGPGKRF